MADNNKPINRSDMRNVTINPKGSRINQDRNPYNPDNGLFKRLTRLFSGPIVNRRQQQYKSERRRRLDKYNFQSAQGQQFKKSSYNPFDYVHSQSMANQNRSERYVDFEQMEYCLHGDTKIAVPGGYKTIKELAEEYGTTEKFVIYAYDHAKKQIVPAFGKQARKTRTDHAWKVIFENGQEIIGTANHRLMMRDGTYRMIEQLNVGDSLMPFYRKDLSHGQKDEGDGYRWIYTMHQDSERKKGWIAEHTLIAEWVAGRKVTPDEVVHHINFTKYDNRPENVLIMNSKEHLRYHQNIVNEQRKNTKWWNNFKQNHSEWMKKNNPSERKDITFEVILSLCDQHGYNQKNICHMLDTDPNTIKRKLKTKGFDSFEIFAKTYKTGWRNDGCDNTGGKNPRYDHTLTFGNICNTYKKGMTCTQLALSLNTTAIKISKRIKDNGYANFTDFYNNYSNHKVSKIEYYGFIDLYDLTVDGYKNFATDSVISHNTAEINSALDIYADEMTTSNSLERVLNIDCPNEEIKSVLDTLYYDILNIEFNLFGWSRTMCKFGDFFLYLDIDEKDGVKNAIGLPTYEVERIEGEDENNPNYIQFQWNSGGMTFENWQIGHFRILGNDKYAPYGTSVLEGARRIWRQLCIAKGENILTPFGYRPIERISAGDVVFCYDPDTKQTKETKVIAQKHMGKQKVYKLKTNHRSIKITDNHGMLVLDHKTKEFVYKQAKEIVVGKDKLPLTVIKDGYDTVSIVVDSNRSVSLKEKLAYDKNNIMETIRQGNFDYSDKAIHAFLQGNKRIPYEEWVKVSDHFEINTDMAVFWNYNSKKQSLLASDGTYTIDKNFARLFGFLLGDGWTANNRVGFAEGIDDDRNNFYRNILENLSCSQASYTPPLKGHRGGQSNVFSQEFKLILDAAGFETGALNKKVPDWVYSLDIESRREFITGYFDADGSYGDGRATSISHNLVDGIREIAMMSGIPVGEIKKDREEGLCADGCYRQASFRLYMNMDKDSWNDEVTLENALSFEFVGEEDTYDIQVEDELHNFIVNGLVSHNTLLEDAMMAYRIVRSAERRVFYVDVGNVAPSDVEQFMQKAMTTLKRNQVVDEKTGRVDLRYNPLSIEEDYFIPVRGQASTKIESLAGGQYTGDIDDVKYLRDKLFSALKVPQSYLARGEGSDEDKTTLAQKDIRFARTIQRLQRAIVSELEKIGIIHLFILGYRNEDLIKFKLKLNNPSKIAELQELETWKTKFDVASGATEGYFSRRWVAKKIFNMTDEEFLRNQREMFYDSKFKAAVEKAGSEQEAAAGDSDAGLGGLDMGSVTSGDAEVPPVDLGALTAEPEGEAPMPDNAAAEAPAAGEDTSLLAAPGKRDDRETSTPASKGKFYLPSKFKGGDKRDIGARARSYSSKWGQQQTGKSERSRLGSGTQELFGLGNGIFEEYENSYNEQIIKEEKISPVEGQILKNSSDLKKLLKSLENKDAGKKDVKN